MCISASPAPCWQLSKGWPCQAEHVLPELMQLYPSIGLRYEEANLDLLVCTPKDSYWLWLARVYLADQTSHPYNPQQSVWDFCLSCANFVMKIISYCFDVTEFLPGSFTIQQNCAFPFSPLLLACQFRLCIALNQQFQQYPVWSGCIIVQTLHAVDMTRNSW